MILFFRPFDTGDLVEAGGVSGAVESMNLIATADKRAKATASPKGPQPLD